MSVRGPYRRHSTTFKLQFCSDIRSGRLGRQEAQRTYDLSANLIRMWLTCYDRGELQTEEDAAEVVTEYQAGVPRSTLSRLSVSWRLECNGFFRI
jgi:transposase